MCGIFCSVRKSSSDWPSRKLEESLRDRGPDSIKGHHVTIHSHGVTHLTFCSTVLALRGTKIHAQPLLDDLSRSVLCWNGEAWKVDDTIVEGNDSLHIFRLLLEASQDSLPNDIGILSILNQISGPFAFTYYDAIAKRLYFGRDRLGRRSLLYDSNDHELLRLCSTSGAEAANWVEVPYDGIHILDLTCDTFRSELIPWQQPLPSINPSIPTSALIPLRPQSDSVTMLRRLMHDSIRLRVADIPSLGADQETATSNSVKVAILFSGGLDCSVIARMAHNILPYDQPVDLLNVAFENPRSIAAAGSNAQVSPYEMCPDRVTGRRSFLELQKICPGRKFHFVAIDVPFIESQRHQHEILALIYPHKTEMDVSIAKALYFASRGHGAIDHGIGAKENPQTPYSSPARVLLSGLGADELFAGYTRHATAYNRRSFPGLIDELSLDIMRLGQRNLGRDDRIISHWGKEVRYPYLDEDLVRWALGAPVWEKCGFGQDVDLVNRNLPNLPLIEPAKQILRYLALNLGLESVSREKKRAIQFGARTAKMQGGRTKGTDTIS